MMGVEVGQATAMSAGEVVAGIWRQAGLAPQALQRLALTGRARGFASGFAAVTAVQAGAGAAALAATEIERLRNPSVVAQSVAIDAQHAAFETSGYFTLDGHQPDAWAPISGLYPCGAESGRPGWVRIHANFEHHRDGALALLGLPVGSGTPRVAVEQALRHWSAEQFESDAARLGLPVAASRGHAEWQALGHEAMVAAAPLVAIERIGDAPPLAWPQLGQGHRPLAGLRVLDLTRILAGPVAGRTLAAYGADVMLINGPHLPNIEAIADTSRGKRSALVDLRAEPGRQTLRSLVGEAQVFMQAYRPGALQDRGFGAEQLARMRPGIVAAELSAYGWHGPWAGRRGFDSLVQTATGINVDEARVFGASRPRPLPMQVLDYGAGFLLAFGIEAALLRQCEQGGSWRVRVSLAGVAHWLRSLGREAAPDREQARPDIAPYLEALDGGFGRLQAVRHCARFSRTPPAWDRPGAPPGSDAPLW